MIVILKLVTVPEQTHMPLPLLGQLHRPVRQPNHKLVPKQPHKQPRKLHHRQALKRPHNQLQQLSRRLLLPPGEQSQVFIFLQIFKL